MSLNRSKNLLILFFSSIFFSSQSQNIKPPRDQNKIYAYKGIIGKNIPVFVWMTMRDDVLFGQIIYKKSSKPIKLRGINSELYGGYRIMEFDSTGYITGIITGKDSDKGFTGEWFSPKTRKVFPLNLQRIDTVLNLPDTSTTAVSYSGNYGFSYDNDGPMGYFGVSKIAPGSFIFEISNVSSGPSYSLALVEPDTVIIKDDQFIYRLTSQEKCAFRVRFYNDILVVDYIKDMEECIFGVHAFIHGIYLKNGNGNER